MSEPMDLALDLTRRIADALAAAFPDTPSDPALRRSDRADFQVNAAMALAKRLGKPPRDVAAALVARVDPGDVVEKLEIAGPGFINVTVKASAMERALGELAADPRRGVGAAGALETVVIDYSAPNVAKELHVGHLRSTIIGDSLARVLEARGHRVIRQNHLGDWGTPFGMLIEHLVDLGLGAPEATLRIEDLNAFYRAARAKFDGDAAFADRARSRVVALQGGDALSLALWKKLCDESRRYFGAVYARLGVTLQDADVAGESLYNPVLAEVVRELEDKGLAKASDGALCVFPPGFTTREGDPLPLIVRKQDGGYGYGTTDLAAIRHRLGVLHGTRLVYVVGSPQAQHLAMVFAIAKLAGWLAPPARAEHVAFGSVLGPDRKMFKTRDGETVRLAALLDEACERASRAVAEKSPDVAQDERDAIARAVGIGAIKYADLSSDRIKDYVFDWDRMLAFEGNTAPYLMYAHARARSILRKAETSGEAALEGGFRVVAPQERALALELLGFGAAVSDVEGTLEPHRLCTYLYGLATAYSSFFETCPVLKAATEEERRARLALCELTARTVARGLDLLGIAAPDRM